MTNNPAPQIPNLLTSLRPNAHQRPRPPRRPDPSTPSSQSSSHPRTSTPTTIASTDTDAAGSRLSAVRAGYLADPYAEAFYTAPDARHVRRMPIINRGTYVRTCAVDHLVAAFLRRHAKSQVLSLGAGTDTRFLRLVVDGEYTGVRWVEVDFAATVERKRVLLSRGDGEEERGGWVGLGLDLRDLKSRGPSLQRLKDALDAETPTLVLSEMCLTYLPPEESSAVLAVLAAEVVPAPTGLRVVLYEPLEPSDAFGRTMVRNLTSRGIELPGLHSFGTLAAHGKRLLDVGMSDWTAMTVGSWWNSMVSDEEKQRLRDAEMVDEEEEWVLLAGHYGLVWAWRE